MLLITIIKLKKEPALSYMVLLLLLFYFSANAQEPWDPYAIATTYEIVTSLPSKQKPIIYYDNDEENDNETVTDSFYNKKILHALEILGISKFEDVPLSNREIMKKNYKILKERVDHLTKCPISKCKFRRDTKYSIGNFLSHICTHFIKHPDHSIFKDLKATRCCKRFFLIRNSTYCGHVKNKSNHNEE